MEVLALNSIASSISMNFQSQNMESVLRDGMFNHGIQSHERREQDVFAHNRYRLFCHNIHFLLKASVFLPNRGVLACLLLDRSIDEPRGCAHLRPPNVLSCDRKDPVEVGNT